MSSEPVTPVLEEKQPHPLDEATFRYKSSATRIQYLNGILSKKSLGRVYNAVIGFPLSDNPPKFKGLENELFMLTLTALSAKEYILDFVLANRKELTELSKPVTESISEERIEESYVK